MAAKKEPPAVVDAEIVDFKGYMGSSTIKRAGVQVNWTKENIAEYIKCSKDPIYFAERYMKIVHVDHGLMTIPLYDYQKEIILTAKDNRFVIGELCRQSGKCVHINSNVNIRNKKTGVVETITIGEFFERNKAKIA